jgi:hypothetical protein
MHPEHLLEMPEALSLAADTLAQSPDLPSELRASLVSLSVSLEKATEEHALMMGLNGQVAGQFAKAS